MWHLEHQQFWLSHLFIILFQLHAEECRTISGRNLYTDTGKIEWDLPAGSFGIADYQFQTFNRQGNPGYQNIGIWVTKFKSGYGVEPHLVYERGSKSDSIQVTNSGIYFYVDPYGSADDKGSAYGGSWRLKVCIKKAAGMCNVIQYFPIPQVQNV